jgi:uncharacterized membrane protein
MASFPPPLSPTPAQTDSSGRPAGGATVAAGRGIEWWREGWRLFTAAPVEWIVTMIVFAGISIGVTLIPVLGQFASMLLTPILIGGVMLGCRAQQRGGKLAIGDLFACFSNDRLTPLLIVGLVYLAGWFVIWVVTLALVVAVVGVGSIGALMSGEALEAGLGALAAFSLGTIFVVLVALTLVTLLLMAFWYAPALVALRGDEPVAAMKTSFRACGANFMPLLVVYASLGVLFAIVATIPFGLGWFVLMPVSAASLYASYRDIFGD